MAKESRQGAPPCGLWLKVGPDLALDLLLKDLREIFFVVNNGSAYERNMHVLEVIGGDRAPDAAEKTRLLCELARQNGFAVIYRGAATTAKDLGADGVLLHELNDIAPARELFGEAGIVGLHCGTSAEAAAAAYDAEADFVMFGTGKTALPSI